MAAIERRRSQILEAMTANKPLGDILKQIQDLVSFLLNGASCWCEMADGTWIGERPAATMEKTEVERNPIAGTSGAVLGTLCGMSSGSRVRTREALSSAVELIVLAVKKSRLHSDLVRRSEFDLLTEIHNRFWMENTLTRRSSQRRSRGIDSV